jgi:hypothetical protein
MDTMDFMDKMDVIDGFMPHSVHTVHEVHSVHKSGWQDTVHLYNLLLSGRLFILGCLTRFFNIEAQEKNKTLVPKL